MPRYSCRYCGIALTKNNTYKGRIEHRDYKCIECERRTSKESYHKNKKKHAEYNRTSRLTRKYGITVEEYDKMFYLQQGCCAICGNPETNLLHGQPRRLAVDHNHSTGEVRALLCTKCNALLGYADEDSEILSKAIEYLERMG